MISLRHHVISLIAVLLALAVGIVLGSTSLSERLLSHVGQERDSLGRQVEELEADRAALRGELDGAHRFSAATAPLAVQGRLADRGVVLFSSWDVPEQDRAAMRGMVEASGAQVTGEVRLSEAVADPDRSDQVRRLVTRLLPAGVQLPTATDVGTLTGGLLGPLTLVDQRTGAPQVSPEERSAAISGLTEGGFATAVGEVRSAPLALVLTGQGSGGAESAGAADRAAFFARFASQLDRSGGGAVLAGGRGSAAGDGAVGFARADTAVSSALSTVDNADTPQGEVAAVLALREQLDRRAGHYGTASSAEGMVPGTRD
ncbi:copper transporter [Saccharopolyspora sp. NFXS83]|uniref:copper transporter n=1 Tax=Saccharopolyspora sp. NFXS83 TaxID=2993560 RepID=UPI00224AD7CA|nr:copper transporter [Saccharopolyspora sp. NFXS83]MCX2732999.1 copper transporter [Saccharopolyspora sp. NFXS83]